MSKIRIGTNGFGRIGRSAFKQFVADDDVEVVGINDRAYLLKYDSVHGWYPRKVSHRDTELIVDDRRVRFFYRDNPGDVLRDRVVKVLAWYDNEWGYSARLVDMSHRVAEKGW